MTRSAPLRPPARSRGGRRPAPLTATVVLTSLLLVAGLVLVPTAPSQASADAHRVVGTLQTSPERLAATTAAGVDLATLEVSWDRFEPAPGTVDAAYVARLRDDLAAYRAAGRHVVLSPGVHYTPSWVLALPDSRFVNQHGVAYAPGDSGKQVANMVFNQAMRDRQAAYLTRLLRELGTDFWGVRLGGGWYGELNYPDASYAGRSNTYWGFDRLATGQAPGLPAGMTPNPVPGWTPGTRSADHRSARSFLDWYMASLDHYHDWQISTVRDLYPGRLLMMYPSWGVRPGQLDAAVAADLDGSTSAEQNGEVQRGFDVARFIGGITDPGVVVYTTWLDADPSQDGGADQRWWSPVKYLAHLARSRPVPLHVMGENTGRNDVAAMRLSFSQARTLSLLGVVWAFEPDLFSGDHATVHDLAATVAADRATTTAPPAPTPTAPATPTPAPAPVSPAPAPVSPAPAVVTTSLPPAPVRRPYSTSLTASGGTGDLRWQATGLPPGLRLGSTGVLSGTPTKAGTWTVRFEVTDAAGAVGRAALPLQVRTVRVTRNAGSGAKVVGAPRVGSHLHLRR